MPTPQESSLDSAMPDFEVNAPPCEGALTASLQCGVAEIDANIL